MAFNQSTKGEIARARNKRTSDLAKLGEMPTAAGSVKVRSILGVPQFEAGKGPAKSEKPLSQDARQQAERIRQERAAGGEVMSPRKKAK